MSSQHVACTGNRKAWWWTKETEVKLHAYSLPANAVILILVEITYYSSASADTDSTSGMGQQPQLLSEFSQQLVSSGHSDSPSLQMTGLTNS